MRLSVAVFATCCTQAAGLLLGGEHNGSLLSDGLPLAWFHIPKTGSSFGNLLLHTPKVCPGTPKGFVIDKEHCGKPTYIKTPGPPYKVASAHVLTCPQFNNLSVTKMCTGLSKWGQHEGMNSDWTSIWHGHAAGFFRQPDKRLLSHYNHFMKPWKVPLSKLLKRYRGCGVKMMMRSGQENMGNCIEGPPPSEQETQEAIVRVQSFAFVGITEQWDLSVCLFRKIFGGQCTGSDFVDTRPTQGTHHDTALRGDMEMEADMYEHSMEGESFFGTYDPKALGGFADEDEYKLYDAALKKFKSLLQKHSVTAESCAACFANKEKVYTPV